MFKRFQHATRSLQALILGQRCAACETTCAGSPVCNTCSDLAISTLPRCPRCATPLTTGSLCGACIRKPPSFDAAIAIGQYSAPQSTLIAQFKFEQRLVLAKWFAQQLDTAIGDLNVDVITPMALHENRLRERGYNQAWEMVKRMQHPSPKRHLLTRWRDTPSQRSVSAASRFSNVRGAFTANESLEGLHVLLVDDVVTTTATVEAASKALKTAGAFSVTVACLARVSD
jgi:ComF family protein